MIEVGPANRQTHEAALIFLFGSLENYRNSPQLKHVIARAEECGKLADGVEALYKETTQRVSWFKIYTKLYFILGSRLVKLGLIKQLRQLQVRYANQRGLPAKVIINAIDNDFNKLIGQYPEVINHVRERL